MKSRIIGGDFSCCDNDHQKIIYKWNPRTKHDCPICTLLHDEEPPVSVEVVDGLEVEWEVL